MKNSSLSTLITAIYLNLSYKDNLALTRLLMDYQEPYRFYFLSISIFAIQYVIQEKLRASRHLLSDILLYIFPVKNISNMSSRFPTLYSTKTCSLQSFDFRKNLATTNTPAYYTGESVATQGKSSSRIYHFHFFQFSFILMSKYQDVYFLVNNAAS